MADTYTAVDLSRLPAPSIVEALDFDTIYASMIADLQARLPSFDATVESDPAVKLLEVCAYRELLLRARINDAARAVMIAFATGTDLDQLAAIFGLTRLSIAPADPVAHTPAVFEADVDLRRRLTLAPESYSVAGPAGAYIFHALSADPRVLDASATSPSPGQVLVTVLARDGDGGAPADLVAAVSDYLSADHRRPLTDHLLVQSAEILAFEVAAELAYYPGPDATIVLQSARARLAAHLAANLRLGRDVTRAGLIAALYTEGVQNVTLVSPADDVAVSGVQAPYCTAVTLTDAGTLE